LLTALGIEGEFDAVIGGDTMPVRKPDPAPFRRILERFNVAPHQALVIGDSDNDWRAARALGIPMCLVAYGYGQPEDEREADFVIERFSELEKVLNGAGPRG
jgi:phosphoglycolate phosphatase